MHYDEKVINGILHYRNTLKGEWVETSKRILTNMVMDRDAKIRILEAKINEFKKIVSGLLK